MFRLHGDPPLHSSLQAMEWEVLVVIIQLDRAQHIVTNKQRPTRAFVIYYSTIHRFILCGHAHCRHRNGMLTAISSSRQGYGVRLHISYFHAVGKDSLTVIFVNRR